MARGVNQPSTRLALAVLVHAMLLAGIPGSFAADPVATAPAPSRPSTRTIVDLQPFRSEARVPVQRADNVAGDATLVNLNPQVNAWFLLTLDWGAARPREVYHLENARPARTLALHAGSRGFVEIDFGDRSPACALPLAGADGRAGALGLARASGLPYAPICDGRLYVRNQTVGRASSLEKVTDFLRDSVWGGEKIVTLVKKELYRDAFLEQGEPRVMTRTGAAPASAPSGAIIDPASADLAVVPSDLGLDVDTADRALLLGQWYGLRGLPDVYLSAVMPEVIARSLLDGHERSVNRLDPIESKALVYLVAFDLGKFDLGFALGTEHPRLGWSQRPPPASIDRTLPGPDGIDRAAPLAITGMVSPEDAARTVAAFTGGFKREHGAFRYGALALRNHGSHYGFVEQGVVFSKLQPGLATAVHDGVGRRADGHLDRSGQRPDGDHPRRAPERRATGRVRREHRRQRARRAGQPLGRGQLVGLGDRGPAHAARRSLPAGDGWAAIPGLRIFLGGDPVGDGTRVPGLSLPLRDAPGHECAGAHLSRRLRVRRPGN